jgi:plastocyanin
MRRALAILGAAAVAVTVGVGGLLLTSGVSAAETVPATIQDYAFTPADITVAAGDTVTWTNGDKAPHTVTSTGGGPLDSPNLQQGDSWSFTFTQPGAYPFYCAVHPDMKGTVTVTAAATGTPAPTAAPTTTAGHGMDMSPTTTVAPGSTSSSGPGGGVIAPFWAHLQKGHLEASPAQQVSDIMDLDQYVKTHTVLVEDMLAPLLDMSGSSPVASFWAHVEKGHLEASPAQQVDDIMDLDQYVKTHTVLVENMLKPVLGG